MSVLDSGTIDGMATDENGKALILLISDHLDWKNEYDHLLELFSMRSKLPESPSR